MTWLPVGSDYYALHLGPGIASAYVYLGPGESATTWQAHAAGETTTGHATPEGAQRWAEARLVAVLGEALEELTGRQGLTEAMCSMEGA